MFYNIKINKASLNHLIQRGFELKSFKDLLSGFFLLFLK